MAWAGNPPRGSGAQAARAALDGVREPLLDGLRDPLVELLALAAQQAVVGGVLHQGVLELVDSVRRGAAAIDELGVDELRERPFERGSARGDTAQQLVRRTAAERRAPTCATSFTAPRRSRRAISDPAA